MTNWKETAEPVHIGRCAASHPKKFDGRETREDRLAISSKSRFSEGFANGLEEKRSVPILVLFSPFVVPFSMDVQDTYVADDVFTQFLEHMPQVCVEIVLETGDGILLCKRTNKPRVWFWPGGRLFKGEELADAAHRVAADELGIDISLIGQLGVHSHFWEPAETNEGVSRHTVNILFHARPKFDDFDITLDEQHSEYRFLAERDSELHPYVREYLTTYELL